MSFIWELVLRVLRYRAVLRKSISITWLDQRAVATNTMTSQPSGTWLTGTSAADIDELRSMLTSVLLNCGLRLLNSFRLFPVRGLRS